jgi:hypothetical protein
MAKKNANNAIDFTRLLAVKDQLPALAPLTPAEAEAEPAANTPTSEPPFETREHTAAVLDFPRREPSDEPLLEPGAPTAVEGVHLRDADAGPADSQTVVLRIGMSRTLHDRVRASAALEGKSPAHLARELLSNRTPLFPRSTSMAALAKQARDSFPTNAARARVDVRMQVPIDSDLHRRLHQLAALRAQTLVACISDLFDASVPGM